MSTLVKIKDMVVTAFSFTLGIILIAGGILFAMGIKPSITVSGSMEPEIKTGSLCFVNTRASFYDVEEGDVIAFETPTGGMVTHRVIGAEEGGIVLITKGDNNEISDGPTTSVENFRGETLFSIPYLGYAVAAIQKPPYKWITYIAIGGLVLLTIVDMCGKDEEDEKI